MMNKQRIYQQARTMRTTTVRMNFNMGYMDGTEEKTMSLRHAEANRADLTQCVMDLTPDPADLDLESDIQQITFVSLELVEWSPPDEGWAEECIDEGDRASCTYIMQLTVGIHHNHPIAFNTAQAVVDAIYEGGAMFPFTPDADADAAEFPHTFLYPYHSEVSDLDDGICIGRQCDLGEM